MSAGGERRGPLARLADLGPGLAMAATGVGAGDLAAAMFAGARFGEALLWAIALGACVKFALNEGIARWQLATGTPLLEGWCRHLGRPFRYYFLAYLVFWSFVVGGALMSACGVAAHALVPSLSIGAWGALHSLVAFALVLGGRYALFERVMSILAAFMVASLLLSAAFFVRDFGAVARGLFVPSLPLGSATAVLGLVGGIGGSVSLLAYGYWIRERGWIGAANVRRVRVDLAIAYALTGLFGMAVLVLASQSLGARSGGAIDSIPAGSKGLIALADTLRDALAERLGPHAGGVARTTFLLGVWATVFTSVLGVWQGIPYLFADFRAAFAGRFGERVDTRGRAYRGYLIYIAFVPMVLLTLGRPVWLILAYTVVSSAFMPLLAGSLLWLNSRRALVGGLRNGVSVTAVLTAALLLLALLAFQEVREAVAP
ncbi:MAG: Nramp family divalent metal transporter [bacterium]